MAEFGIKASKKQGRKMIPEKIDKLNLVSQ